MPSDSRFHTAPSAGPSRRSGLLVVVLMLAGLGAATVNAQSEMPLPQIWTGRMEVPPGVEPGVTADRFELRIFSTSTDAEVVELIAALQAEGQVGLRNAMYRLRSKGWIRIGALAATEIVVLRVFDLPDGRRRVRLYSDHPLRLYDKTDPPGSDAHPFGFLELTADASGAGTGELIAAGSMTFGDEGLRIDSAGTPLIKVYDVTTDRPPVK